MAALTNRGQEAKSHGVKLGGLAEAVRRSGRLLRATPTGTAQDLVPVVVDIRAGGATSLRAIAEELNVRGMLTRHGGRWHVSIVTNLSTASGSA